MHAVQRNLDGVGPSTQQARYFLHGEVAAVAKSQEISFLLGKRRERVAKRKPLYGGGS